MAKKVPLTRDEHEGIGNTLREMSSFLSALTVKVHKHYLTADANKCVKARVAVDNLRSLLDEHVCAEHKHIPGFGEENNKLISIYF